MLSSLSSQITIQSCSWRYSDWIRRDDAPRRIRLHTAAVRMKDFKGILGGEYEEEEEIDPSTAVVLHEVSTIEEKRKLANFYSRGKKNSNIVLIN